MGGNGMEREGLVGGKGQGPTHGLLARPDCASVRGFCGVVWTPPHLHEAVVCGLDHRLALVIDNAHLSAE